MLEQPGLLEETSGEMLAPVAVAVELPGAIRYPSLLPSLTPAELKSSYLSSGPTVPSFAWEKSSPSEFSSSFSHSADLHDSSRECKFTAPFDTNGALYVIATASKTCPYVNPVTSDLLTVRWSSVGSGKPDDFVSHGTPRTMAATANQPNSWMEVDLIARRLQVDFYALRRGTPQTCLRSWQLQGSESAQSNGARWVTLSQHDRDDSLLHSSNCTSSWPVSACGSNAGKGFRRFRIVQQGVNAGGNHVLACCGIELYGILTSS